jgi:hypothetical protein
MLSDFMAYLQYQLGAQTDAAGHAIADTSWSAQLQASDYLWMLLEGTHVLTLMLFAGTIMLVDLRLLGLAFRATPVSKVNDTLLPYTVAGFAVMVVTGVALFYANPLEYYHSFMFRLKLLFILAAAINIFLFHRRIQRNRAQWDALARPPAAARASAATSLALWIAVIIAGRYVAYEWFSCDTVTGFVAAVSECPARTVALAHLEAEMVQ